MSRIGLKPIPVPSGVEIKVGDGNVVTVKGPKGELKQELTPELTLEQKDGEVLVHRPTESKKHKSLHGLTRTLLNNMVEGVTKGYEKVLLIEGTGYRAAKNGKKLTLSLGYSHPIEMEDPSGIEVEVPQQTKIIIRGIDKQQVGNYAAVLRAFRKPEPYKGKGVRYENEVIRRKVGKTGK